MYASIASGATTINNTLTCANLNTSGQGVGGYAGAIGGGLQQNVGGFTSLYSVNAGVYTEVSLT